MSYILAKDDNVLGIFHEESDWKLYIINHLINFYQIINQINQLNNNNLNLPDMGNFKIVEINNLNIVIDTKIINKNNLQDLMSDDDINLKNKFSELSKLVNIKLKIKQEKIEYSKENLEEVKKRIKLLMEKKNIKIKKINEKKNILKEKKSNFDEEFIKNQEDIRLNQINKEKLEEAERKFRADKEVYFKIKDTIDENNIPELFQNQYPILKEMETKKLFNTEDEFNYYYREIQKKNKNIGSSKYYSLFS